MLTIKDNENAETINAKKQVNLALSVAFIDAVSERREHPPLKCSQVKKLKVKEREQHLFIHVTWNAVSIAMCVGLIALSRVDENSHFRTVHCFAGRDR